MDDPVTPLSDDTPGRIGLIREWMPDLSPDQVTEEILRDMTDRFVEIFVQQYRSSGLKFCVGSLNRALAQSIFHQEFPRPLILYIRHGDSPSDNIFCEKFLRNKEIVNRLNTEFIIWPWDRTSANLDQLLVKLLTEAFGEMIASQIVSPSRSVDQHPLLVSLAMRNESQFKRIAHCLNLEEQKIILIQKVRNLPRSTQYTTTEMTLNDSEGPTSNEEELFYGCPVAIASDILQHGFNLDIHCIHGEKHGRGFYFSSERDLCEQYQGFETSDEQKRAILICQIPVAHSRRSDDSKIVIADQNEYIHPEYLVLYTR